AGPTERGGPVASRDATCGRGRPSSWRGGAPRAPPLPPSGGEGNSRWDALLCRLGYERTDRAVGDLGGGSGQDRRLRRARLAQLRHVHPRLLGDDLEHLVAVEHFLLEERAGDPVHGLLVVV